MSTVAIFIFTLKCPACKRLYEKLPSGKTRFEEIVDVFKSKNIRVIQFYKHDPSLPSFLKITTFAPTTIIMPERLYLNWQNINFYEIYSEMVVMNADILMPQEGVFRVSRPRQTYAFLIPSHYEMFINDTRKTDMTTKFYPPKLEKQDEIKTQDVNIVPIPSGNQSSNGNVPKILWRNKIQPFYH